MNRRSRFEPGRFQTAFDPRRTRMNTKNCYHLCSVVSLCGKFLLFISLAVFLSFALTACGGPNLALPTAIPPDITVPDQPIPVYVDDAERFTLATPRPPVIARAGATAGRAISNGAMSRTAVVLPYQQTPSALGIVRGGAALRIAPGGLQIDSLPAGATVTITGKSADGLSYAVFDPDGRAGWLSIGTVSVYGGDDLVVVETASGPGPVATLMAEAMVPVEPSVLKGVGRE